MRAEDGVSMKIPTRFKLMGQTIEVVWKDHLNQERNRKGEAHYWSNEIWLQRENDGMSARREMVDETFCHELVHWLMFFAGQDYCGKDMTDDEHLVGLLGCLLHQALVTMEYEE